MGLLDWVVLVVYFATMAGIGVWAMRTVKVQEDYFLGGRSFGKLIQTFAAFGAGTGSADPVNTARTTFTSGLSGMWSVMSWLFVTPFYWIAAVWYRRMRHLTLGDWFVERYESRALGAAYTLFGLLFYMVYTAMLFTATGKVAAPMIGETFTWGATSIPIEYVLVPIIAVIVMTYGVLGGLTAAYWTDLVQGLFIILLSVMLIPFGLSALVAKFGATHPGATGFEILHDQLPGAYFHIVGSGASEFPIHRIAAVVVILLIGIVVTPHFIATGGGSAKTELDARVGLVTGNLFKRVCTIGWALTALIVLALMSDRPEVLADPDKAWGVASLELLPMGMRGLMLACLLAALMSSADTYMLVCSALVVRNLYAPYVNDHASEQRYVMLGRLAGAIVIIGAVAFSWSLMDVFAQLQLTWIVPMLFAAPFWIGLWWRRATTLAAWGTLFYGLIIFFVAPKVIPAIWPDLRASAALTAMTDKVTTTIHRPAAPSDVAQGRARKVGDTIDEKITTGGRAIFWTGDIKNIDLAAYRTMGHSESADRTIDIQRYEGTGQASGDLNLDYLPLIWVGVDLRTASSAMLDTLSLVPKIVMPFVVMIVLSLVTPRNSKAALDKYYAKMKTPIARDPAEDRRRLEEAMADPAALERRKLLPGTSIEIQRPTLADVGGFTLALAACGGIIALTALVARLGL